MNLNGLRVQSVFLSAMCICVSITEAAQATVIYSQTTPAQPTGAFASTDEGRPTDQKIADNFSFGGPNPITIRSLSFIGGYGVTNPPPQTPPLNALPPDDFHVVFFADSAGAPGTPLANGDFMVVPSLRTPTGGPLLNGLETPIAFVLDLGTGVTLNPATIYWVSIVNNPGPSYSWAWARANGVLDQQVASTYGEISSGPWQITFNTGGMFFELSNNNVPEPDSVALCAVAAFHLICVARMRRTELLPTSSIRHRPLP